MVEWLLAFRMCCFMSLLSVNIWKKNRYEIFRKRTVWKRLSIMHQWKQNFSVSSYRKQNMSMYYSMYNQGANSGLDMWLYILSNRYTECECVSEKMSLKTELQDGVCPLNYGTVKVQISTATYRTLTEGAQRKSWCKQYHILLEKRKQGNECQESGKPEVSIHFPYTQYVTLSLVKSYMFCRNWCFRWEREGAICFPKCERIWIVNNLVGQRVYFSKGI